MFSNCESRTRARRTRAPVASALSSVVAALPPCALLLLSAASALFACADPARAQQPSPTPQITQAQAELYERWRSNINTNQQVAFDAGREYLAKYPADEYARYVRPWIEAYDKAARGLEFQRLFKSQRFGELYAVGARILRGEPDDLRTLVHLAYAGYLASAKGDDTHSADALAYARRAQSLIESGAKPTDWQPFVDKDDALAYLNFVVGELTFKDDPAASSRLFLRALSFDSTLRREPVIYSRLAASYVASQYDPLSQDYQERFAGKDPTDESRAALERVNAVVDRIIDAYARAVALSGDDAKYAEPQRRWTGELTRFYKFRHDGSTEGLDALIASAVSKPLPEIK
ncbi:MAG: hypothetical protein LC746_09305 [Acidobacteria bacterium]|nr:hypothetical protein [Acidobacteriota bacterium]